MRHLKQFYTLASAEAQFSDDLGAGNHKENLAVIQRATKKLQHAYGIVATSSMAMDGPDREAAIVKIRPGITRRTWTAEDDCRLFKLKILKDCRVVSVATFLLEL
jgi:hypothetical protein